MFSPTQILAAANAVQTVEALVASVAAQPTGAQKLDAAVTIAATLDPTVAAYVDPLKALMSSLVAAFNLLGIFKRTPPVPAPVAATSPQ